MARSQDSRQKGDSSSGQGSVKDERMRLPLFDNEQKRRPQAKEAKPDKPHTSLITMDVSWVLALVILAVAVLWDKPEVGLVHLYDLSTGSGTEELVIGGSGIFYRPDDATVWKPTSSGFGSSAYLDEHGEGLPDYAEELAPIVAAPRTIMPALLIAYAFGVLLVLFFAATTGIIGELAGPSIQHKHHHIYRPMLLKACTCFISYCTCINVVALMVPWAIMATANDLPRGSRMKVEGTGGVWLLLLSLALHVSALTSAFHLIAKQRMHLRHPGWVIAVHEQRKQNQAQQSLQASLQQGQHHDCPECANDVASRLNHIAESQQQQPPSYGDMPYGAPQPGDASYQGASVPPPPASKYQLNGQAPAQTVVNQPTAPAHSYGAAAQYYNGSLEQPSQQAYGRPGYERSEALSSQSRSQEAKQYSASEGQTEPLRPKRSGRSQPTRDQAPSKGMEELKSYNQGSSSYGASSRVG